MSEYFLRGRGVARTNIAASGNFFLKANGQLERAVAPGSNPGDPIDFLISCILPYKSYFYF